MTSNWRKIVEWPAKSKPWFVVTKHGVLLFPAISIALLRYPLTASDPSLMGMWDDFRGKISTFTGFFFLIALPLLINIGLDWWASHAEKVTKGDPEKEKMYRVLLASLNEIVGEKANRFSDYSPKIGQNIFQEITQPDTQIKIIIKTLHSFLKLTLEHDFKIVIAEFKSGKMIKIKAFAPSSVNPSLSQEQFESSFFTYIAKRKKTEVIPDIAKEMKKGDRSIYRPSESGVETGSIIGFPVFLKGNKLRFVITIKSDEKIINKKFREGYAEVVEMFLVRVRLECCLSDIKDRSEETVEVKEAVGER